MGQKMNEACPHCTKAIFIETIETEIGEDTDSSFGIISYVCPSCQKIVIKLIEMPKNNVFSMNKTAIYNPEYIKSKNTVYPQNINRPPIPKEVPLKYATDYNEACLILNYSPKASATLSRRCLQSIIHDELNIDYNNLNREIDDVIKNQKFNSQILALLHSLREFGNFGAHSTKDTKSGEILEVEPGEAEYCLSILDAIFDFQFVQPAKYEEIKKDLNVKLKAAGKKEIK